MKKDFAFSGLEAAIVLIAFVVVAAVFSYVMLGAGFFATQKSQEVTYSGIKQSTSNIVLDGQVYGKLDTDDKDVEYLYFWLAIPEGGQAQDLTKITYVVTVQNTKVSSSGFGVTYEDGVTLLSPGEKIKSTLLFNPNSGGPKAGESFTLEIKPLVGASSLITKTDRKSVV